MNFNTTQRLEMLETNHEDLSVNRQCNILSISRSRVYYKPVERSGELEDTLMKANDKEHLKCPFYSFRRMTVHLQSLGYAINRKRVRRLMKLISRLFILIQTLPSLIQTIKSTHTCSEMLS